jgi:hypothetical protein
MTDNKKQMGLEREREVIMAYCKIQDEDSKTPSETGSKTRGPVICVVATVNGHIKAKQQDFWQRCGEGLTVYNTRR